MNIPTEMYVNKVVQCTDNNKGSGI